MKKKTQVWIFLVLSILCVMFIFSNSLQDRQTSGSISGVIAELLQKLLDPHGRIAPDQFHLIVRKLAHFTEFAMFGFCLCGLCVSLEKQGRCSVLLIAPITAVADELLQSLNDRHPAVTDVLIDCGGALFGMAALLLLRWLLQFVRRMKG